MIYVQVLFSPNANHVLRSENAAKPSSSARNAICVEFVLLGDVRRNALQACTVGVVSIRL